MGLISPALFPKQKAVKIGLAPYTESLDNSGSIPELSNKSEMGVTGNVYYFGPCGWPFACKSCPVIPWGNTGFTPHPGIPKSTPDSLVYIRV